MARSQVGNETGDLDNGIARRAAAALDLNHPGPNKDKRIAQAFLISPGTAEQRRAGRGWTVARLDQAMRLFPGFRDLLFTESGGFCEVARPGRTLGSRPH